MNDTNPFDLSFDQMSDEENENKRVEMSDEEDPKKQFPNKGGFMTKVKKISKVKFSLLNELQFISKMFSSD